MRLALARYQPCANHGVHLSEVVLADVMQLSADRSLAVRAAEGGRSRRVTLQGNGYEASGGSREVKPRSEIDPLSGKVNKVTPVSPTPVVDVWLERLEPTLGSDFGWMRIGNGVPTQGIGAAQLRLRLPLWDGRIELPEPNCARWWPSMRSKQSTAQPRATS